MPAVDHDPDAAGSRLAQRVGGCRNSALQPDQEHTPALASRWRLTRFLSLGENRSQMILAASSRIRESGDLSSCTYLVSDPTELMSPPIREDLSLPERTERL